MIALLMAFTLPFGARPSHAMDKNVKAILMSGAYGMAAGTVLGLASFPFSGNVRNVFIGTSMGLYIGLAVGLYYVFDRTYGFPEPYRLDVNEGQRWKPFPSNPPPPPAGFDDSSRLVPAPRERLVAMPFYVATFSFYY